MEFDRDILALCSDKAIAENSFSTRVNLSMCANASQTRLDGLKNAPGVWYGFDIRVKSKTLQNGIGTP